MKVLNASATWQGFADQGQKAGLWLCTELSWCAWAAGAVGYIAPQVLNHDVKVKRQACCLLAQLAKHSLELAEVVVEADIFPKIYVCLKVADEWVRKHAATAIREVGAAYEIWRYRQCTDKAHPEVP